jgi:hypothetical protein
MSPISGLLRKYWLAIGIMLYYGSILCYMGTNSERRRSERRGEENRRKGKVRGVKVRKVRKVINQ